MSEARLIVGLGNPGRDYEGTRHNLGFMVVERLAERSKAKFAASSFTKSLMAKHTVDGKEIYLFLPITYMNNSGTAIKRMMEEKQIELKDLLVIADDFNIPFGQLRLRPNGSDGGHNGLKSVIEHLGSLEFARLRMGVGQSRKPHDVVAFVLEKFTKEEQKGLDGFVDEAADCCLVWMNEGITNAMDQFNRRKEND